MNWDTKNRAYRLIENKHVKVSKLFKIDVLRAFISTITNLLFYVVIKRPKIYFFYPKQLSNINQPQYLFKTELESNIPYQRHYQ